MLSILLALAADRWREQRARAERVDLATRSIRSEIVSNRTEIAVTQQYHRALADTLFQLAAAGVPQVSDAVHPHGWIRVPDVTAAAWQAAQSGGATADMPQETVLAVARAYERQAEYLRWRDAVMENVHHRALAAGVGALSREYANVAGSISDVAHWERRVLLRYDSALARLGS